MGAVVRYAPDPELTNSVCIAVLLVKVGVPGRVLSRRLSDWQRVLRFDPQADIPLLAGIVEEVEASCMRDPEFLEKAKDWANAVQIWPILHLSTTTPEEALEKLFCQYCEA